MNRLARWILRLYPAQWRARYSDEVDALLADTGADARTVADLVQGGVRMQFSIWSFPKLTLTLGFAGLLLGAAFSLFLPSEYVSKATLQITAVRVDGATVGRNTIGNPLIKRVQQLLTQVDSSAVLTPIVRKLNLYPDAPLNDVVERMRNDIQVNFVAAPKTLKGASAFDIAFTYPDRYKAQQTVEALMTAFHEVNMTSQMRDAATTDRPTASILVLDVANLPEAPSNKSRIVRQLTGFLGNLFPDQYRSEATLRLTHGTTEQVLELTTSVLSRASLSSIINDPRLTLYRDKLRTTSLEDVIELMKRDIRVSLVQGKFDGPVFTLAFEYPDRYEARQTVEALTNEFRRADSEMFSVSAPATQTDEILDVLDTANLPNTPRKPNRPVIALAGGILGIVLGALISIGRRLWTPPAIATLDVVNG